MQARQVDVFYGDNHAIQKVSLDIGRNEVIALIGPSGCGKSTFIRCLNRMNDTIESARITGEITLDGENIYAASHGRRDAARARRHGVPEAESVSEVGLRQRRVRAAHPRARARSRRARRDRADEPRARGALDRGEGPARGAGHGSIGRSAAAPVHRAHDRRQPRRHSHGRAVLGARSDRDGAHRGLDRRAASRTTRSRS